MKKILFLGDSITDAHHNLGVDDRGLGDGYVQMIARRLEESGEEARVENRGHDGFTVQGLWRMLGRDCILRKPDVVSILIGCNDVGIMMNTGKSLNEQGFARYYQNLLEEILTETVADIICMGPFIFPHTEEYRRWIPGILMAEQMVKEAALAYGLPFIPLHEEMLKEADRKGYDALTEDGIHLTREGAKIVAGKWMECWRKRRHDNIKI